MRDFKKLHNQPLVFVLADIGFSPVLDIDKFIPKLQGILRERFPLFRQTESQDIAVTPAGIQVSQQPNWEFITRDHASAVIINQTRLLYITKQYNRFEGFEETCGFLLDALIEVVNPNLFVRLGLRYADTILAIEGKGLAEEFVEERLYNNSELHSTGKPIRQTNETLLKTPEGVMFVRSVYGINNSLSPADAEHFPIKIPLTSDNVSSRIILDFDHMWDANEEGEALDFEKEIILNKLFKMHERNRLAFWDITTDKAKKAWQ